MPVFDFKCKKCGKTWEILVLPHEKEPEFCPDCGGELERIYTGSVGLVFKGSGFYITDYVKKNSGRKENKDKKSGGDKGKD